MRLAETEVLNFASLPSHVEVDRPITLGRVRFYRTAWSKKIDVTVTPRHHWLHLSLLTPTYTSVCRFPDYWEPQHAEHVGVLHFLPAGQTVQFKSDCRRQISIACAFDPVAIQEWLGDRDCWTEKLLKSSLDIDNPTVRGLLLKLGAELRSPGFASGAMIEHIVGQVAIELGRHLLANEDKREAGSLAPWRLRLIDERLALPGQSPRLGELAELVGLSERQLARAFRAARGCSIGSYIANARIERAKEMLAFSKCVKSVAHDLGFASDANFNASFRRITGETPGAYRMRVRRYASLVTGELRSPQ
ncbi:MAG TPA: AraC family transcriptional regulator [Acetobacteraceae bacterium]|nr:AraC family transcriptional regulator [Acetobacteraceae bacterium]